jgi:hypothetical protein
MGYSEIISKMNTSLLDNVSSMSVATRRRKRKIWKYNRFYVLWRRFRFLGALSSCLALIPATISYEHSYDPNRSYEDCRIIQENTFIYRFPVLLLSFIAIALELAYKHFYFRWDQYYPYTFEELPPPVMYSYLELVSFVRKRHLKEYLKTRYTWLVIFLNLIFPYPGISIKIRVPQYILYERFEICYYLEEFLYFIMFFRLFYLILTICAYGKYEKPMARRICQEHRIPITVSFSYRCIAATHPVIIIVFFLLIPGIIVFGIGIRLFERPLHLQDLDSIENSMWLVLVTMTTVGYGDRVPYSLFGRVVVFFAIIWGGISLSLTFVTIRSFLKLTPKEEHSYRAILAHRECGKIIFNTFQEKFLYNKDKIKGFALALYQAEMMMGLKKKTFTEETLKFRSYSKMMMRIEDSSQIADDILKKLGKFRRFFRSKSRISIKSSNSFLD